MSGYYSMRLRLPAALAVVHPWGPGEDAPFAGTEADWLGSLPEPGYADPARNPQQNPLPQAIRHLVYPTIGCPSLLAPGEELVLDAHPRSMRTLYHLPLRLRRERFDLFHGPFNILPSGLAAPTVVTIHDLMQLQNPGNIAKSRFVQNTAGLFWRTRIRHAVTHATRVLTRGPVFALTAILVTRSARLQRSTSLASDHSRSGVAADQAVARIMRP